MGSLSMAHDRPVEIESLDLPFVPPVYTQEFQESGEEGVTSAATAENVVCQSF
jgi:hypothetical protein